MLSFTTSKCRTMRIFVAILCVLGEALGFHNVVQTRGLPPKSTTRLSLLRNRPDLICKLGSPVGTSTMAAPMFLASTGWMRTVTGWVPPAGAIDVDGVAAATTHGETLLSTVVDATSSVAGSSPSFLEAEVLNDLAHVALDLATFFGPYRFPIRLVTVIGRLCAMASDWIPDHTMLPDELAFQLLMLAFAWVGLVRSALPVALAASASNVTVRDGKAYSLLFRPAGVTWNQFKALSVCALDWVTIDTGRIITSDEHGTEDDFVYWLYSGDVTVQSNGKLLHHVTRGSSPAGSSNLKRGVGRGLLGEKRLLWRLEGMRNGEQPGNEDDGDSAGSATGGDHPRTTVKAGPAGATLLRMRTSNLFMLMNNDEELAHCMRSLLLQGMHDKLAAHLEA